ncbi:hypothetical protein GIB67_008980 [Kingdonia uniflora]|uniref:Uncharacterized protein n=1 Tax=Kingdonia uniflora TaxID=39325 RepID=A0A7J7LVW0_9MAGN|nr:hypothetical protein GIB67_008980 [Kingdonia uniflora]
MEFEDVQPQFIPNPTQENFPRRCITQLPDGVSHIYYTGKELTNRDSMRVHDTFTTVFKVWKDITTIPAVRDAVVNIFGQFMDIRLGNSDNRLIQALIERWWPTTHVSIPLCEDRDSTVSETDDVLTVKLLSRKRVPLQVPNGNCEYYLGDRCWSLPGEVERPDLGWHMEWTGRRERLLIARLRDPPPMPSSYGIEELWHLTHGMRQLVLVESAWNAQRLQEVEDELFIARRQINSIDHQLYAHDLQLRRGNDVRVVPLPPGGGVRTRQRGSGLRTRRSGTSHRGQDTGDDSE